ncbi:HlyD family efflux transporter periplasmic adaptor subunit [Phaeacidiphilus oryzae]|uniref:HlyD family efflux transporter periplasmic adaptor subunit n=1 Tax=Phaeacidiphilus oryzae TaxID=348818 RepID=UPI00056C1C11|nr:HlyD family efflux transporter periplasmic adaptor subunit [Phaeacidiphilus oryzae]
MEFRQKALAKLQSPEELDIPVRFARPQGALVLAVTVLAVAAAAFWAVTGTVTTHLSAPGVLSHPEGSYLLQSPYAGQVTQVLVNSGQTVRADQPVAQIRVGDAVRTVRAVSAGQVTAVSAQPGSVVATGADLATVQRIARAGEPLIAMVYAPAAKASGISAGQSVDLTVQTVPTQQYGVLRGKVLAVARAPQTRQQITDFLGDPALAGQYTQDGQPLAVVVELDRDPGSRSGYRWSREPGPPYPIDSTTQVSASIQLSSQHPIDWLLP